MKGVGVFPKYFCFAINSPLFSMVSVGRCQPAERRGEEGWREEKGDGVWKWRVEVMVVLPSSRNSVGGASSPFLSPSISLRKR